MIAWLTSLLVKYFWLALIYLFNRHKLRDQSLTQHKKFWMKMGKIAIIITFCFTWKFWSKKFGLKSFYIPNTVQCNTSPLTMIWCIVPETWSATDIISCHFEPFLHRFTPQITQKIKILKKWKKQMKILSFYRAVPKIMIICYSVLRYGT